MLLTELHRTETQMSKYKFLVGVTPAALEAELNSADAQEPLLKLRQVLLAPGTGFIAVVEYPDGGPIPAERGRSVDEELKEPTGRTGKQALTQPRPTAAKRPANRKRA